MTDEQKQKEKDRQKSLKMIKIFMVLDNIEIYLWC